MRAARCGAMTRIRTFFKSSFGSALLGGIVAVAVGIGAIASGLVSVDNSSGSTAVASAPLPQTEPASGSDQTVGQVYQEDAQGVAYIEAQEKAGAIDLTVRRAVRAAAPRPARGSSWTATATS